MQIQNMAAIVNEAVEFSTTPYVFAKASFTKGAGKQVTYALSAPIRSKVPAINLALLILKISLHTELRGTRIEVKCCFQLLIRKCDVIFVDVEVCCTHVGKPQRGILINF